MTELVNKPSFIESGKYRFLIMDAPKDSNLHLYLRACQTHNVKCIVRISEPSYSREEVEKQGIALHEMYYHDGSSPPEGIISKWLDIVDSTFADDKIKPDDKPCIAIHCIAGLGRAPVLVTLALLESGLFTDSLTAVNFIRSVRRGAINAVQLKYLDSYKPRKKKDGCSIM